ncbi:HK97 family phage prohead protease [Burkholderia vietnamiensis]|uniref:HK97 family phage prohead protease n=1 Tax=Burkholderia vietnamiensis TaxID=60552 RepID=UPI00075BB926|nr:HK97 family phage prohead protease [Burkholderia vietnamiensis]KVR97206.1 peptidase U35 [Burkholderia vietnamiensis]
MKNRMFSAVLIKSVDEEQRIIEGIASTPTPDRVKDIVEPKGLTFAAEVPLLWMHKHDMPVGSVKFGEPTEKGLPFTAQIAKVDEPGVVKDRTDEAWHSVKTGLVKGTSIGFQPMEYKALPNGGTHFTKASVHELSLVTIPCNPEALISAFKSLVLAETAEAGEVTGEKPVEVTAAETTVETAVVKTPRLVKLDLSYRKY